MKVRSKSVGVLQIQKEINKNQLKNSTMQNQFVPFVKERDLGKLITASKSAVQELTPDQITFKNFQKIYRR